MRKPIILPQDNLFVIMLLCDLHERRWHYGYKSLIHEARKSFWIIELSRRAKTLTSKCVACRKLRKRPSNSWDRSQNLRVVASFPAFSNTAMDIFDRYRLRLAAKL